MCHGVCPVRLQNTVLRFVLLRAVAVNSTPSAAQEAQEDQLFSAINHNPYHLLHHLLPPPSAASQNYELRHRIHTRSLPDRAGHLSDANVILLMIYKDKY